jgi:hypothetical protein
VKRLPSPSRDSPPVIEAFRKLYEEAASREGWVEIWVIGANETFTERLGRASDIA